MVGAHKRVFLFFEEESKRLRAEERCGKLCRGLLCDGLTGLAWPLWPLWPFRLIVFSSINDAVAKYCGQLALDGGKSGILAHNVSAESGVGLSFGFLQV